VQAKLPTKHTSDINNNAVNNSLFTTEYQAVSNAIIKIDVLRIINGKLREWCNSNQEFAGYTTKPFFKY